MLSETDYFHDFENKFYSETISEKEKNKMMYGVQTKSYKEIDLKKLNSFLSKNKSKFIKPRLREYDNFRKLIYNFMRKKYKYVSYVFGGFEKIHEESIKYNIPLLNHDENCFLCKKKNFKIAEILREDENKKSNTARHFFFGRKDSENDKNKNDEKNQIKSPTGLHESSKYVSNEANNKINNLSRETNNSKKEGFFSKLFSRNNKSKSDLKLESNRKLSNKDEKEHVIDSNNKKLENGLIKTENNKSKNLIKYFFFLMTIC